jgi:hypothetical protein
LRRRPPTATLDGFVQRVEELGGSLRHRRRMTFAPGGRGSSLQGGGSLVQLFARLGDAREPRRCDGSRPQAAPPNRTVAAAALSEAEKVLQLTEPSVSQGRTGQLGLGRWLLGRCMLGRHGGH